MNKINRREFVKAVGWAGVYACLPHARVLGANDAIRVGMIGMGDKGRHNTGIFRKIPGVRVVAVCDADQAALDQFMTEYAKEPGNAKVDTYIDFRRILERDDIDAVCISTPNHWHALMGIYACQAGKDIYLEKPVSHTIWEGRQLVKAVHKYNRIVQGGTQNRSDTGLVAFYDWLEGGHLGKIKRMRGLCYRERTGIGKQDTPLVPPSSLDYNLWLGPVTDRPVFRTKFHYDWHWFWHTGNGDLGNQGPHEFNQLAWTVDEALPVRVTTFGGRFGWHDAGETPNMQFCIFELDKGPSVWFETRDMWLKPDINAMPHYRNCRVGVVLEFENGTFIGGRGGGWVYDTDNQPMKQFVGDGGEEHQANFIDAMRQRKTAVLRSPIETNHRSDCWLHLANICYRVAQDVSPEQLRERLQGDKESLDALERYSEQLAQWQIDYNKEPWRYTANLSFDTQNERFTGALADQANGMLHRQDRPAFTVPQQV